MKRKYPVIDMAGIGHKANYEDQRTYGERSSEVLGVEHTAEHLSLV